MPPLLHQRLLNEATQYGTAEVLRQMPAAYSTELEEAIRRGVSQAILYYAEGLEWLDQRLQPLNQAGKART